MGAGGTALLVAVVGVAGTLGAALLTQIRADRTKRMELQSAATQRREERDHAEALRAAERTERRTEADEVLKRSCYIALNTASRQYLTAQVDLLYALRKRTGAEAAMEGLETRRVVHRESYAEAQMIVPAAVLVGAGAASRRLNAAYGELKRIAASSVPTSEDLSRFEDGVDGAWSLLAHMRQLMRDDLGVDAASDLDVSA